MKKVISKDGTAIAFDEIGEGPAIILIDGAFGSRSFGPMVQLAPLLKEHFTVFNYDRRGRNDSGDTAPYRVEREVEDLEALINKAGGSVFVYGISSGAALALEAAASGLNIKKIALYEPPFVVGSGHRPPEDATMQLMEMTSDGRRGDAVEFFMTKLIGIPAEAVAQMKHSPFWPALEAVAHTVVYDVTIMGNWSLPTERLASVTVPALVMDGANSTAMMHHATQALADTIPHVQHRTLEGQTHEVAPETIAPVLEEFFAE